MRKKIMMVSALLILSGGLIVSYMYQGDSNPSPNPVSECQQIENAIQQNKTFNGTIACYPPGYIEVNLSEKVQEQSQLKCVCQRRFGDNMTQIIPIAISNKVNTSIP